MVALVIILSGVVVALCALVIRDHRVLRDLEGELALEACRTRDLEVQLRHLKPPRPPRLAS